MSGMLLALRRSVAFRICSNTTRLGMADAELKNFAPALMRRLDLAFRHTLGCSLDKSLFRLRTIGIHPAGHNAPLHRKLP